MQLFMLSDQAGRDWSRLTADSSWNHQHSYITSPASKDAGCLYLAVVMGKQSPGSDYLCLLLLQGVRWLVGLSEKGLNGILADDMGLGKTVQVGTRC